MQLSHVFLEVEIATKSFGADPAGVRFLVIVGVHVKRKVVDLMKCFVADLALVLLFSRMRQPVVLVVAC